MKKFTMDELYLQMFATYDDILSVDDVAAIMNLDKKRVYRMLRSGEINSMKFDRLVRVPKLLSQFHLGNNIPPLRPPQDLKQFAIII